MLFLGQPGGMADRKEKRREREQSFVLDFFLLLLTHNLAQMCTAHLPFIKTEKVEDE
jgi:hypothetical protein